MTTLLKNRWLWVGALWAGAVFLSIWNHQAIDAILSIQSQNLALRSELTFQQQNARKLERIQHEHSKLFLSAESLQMGTLYVKSMLGELASRLELNVAQMTIAPLQKGAEAVALNLSISGPLEGILHFLSTLNAHRFLQHKQVVIKLNPQNGDGSCEMALLVRCRIQPPTLTESMPNESKVRSAL